MRTTRSTVLRRTAVSVSPSQTRDNRDSDLSAPRLSTPVGDELFPKPITNSSFIYNLYHFSVKYMAPSSPAGHAPQERGTHRVTHRTHTSLHTQLIILADRNQLCFSTGIAPLSDGSTQQGPQLRMCSLQSKQRFAALVGADANSIPQPVSCHEMKSNHLYLSDLLDSSTLILNPSGLPQSACHRIILNRSVAV